MLELHFSGVKSILFYPEYQKIFLSGFLCLKKTWEKGRFYDKNHGLTPLQNVYFLDFFKTSLLRSKEHSFISRISKNISFWLSLLKKNLLKTDRFFLKKTYGLTPLPNSNFLDFFRTSLFKYKKHSFLSRISKNVSFWLPLLKKKYKKKVDFLTKPWTNPFTKCRFFTLLELHISSLKSLLFCPEYEKMFFFLLSLLKKNM